MSRIRPLGRLCCGLHHAASSGQCHAPVSVASTYAAVQLSSSMAQGFSSVPITRRQSLAGGGGWLQCLASHGLPMLEGGWPMRSGALSISMHRALHSSAAAAHAEQTSKDVDEINALFVEARDEIEFALEEADTVSPGLTVNSVLLHSKMFLPAVPSQGHTVCGSHITACALFGRCTSTRAWRRQRSMWTRPWRSKQNLGLQEGC